VDSKRIRREIAGPLLAVLTGLLMATGAAGPAGAAGSDFNEGLDAYLVGNYSKALRIWAPLAESGDETAAFNMGVLYAQGLGVEADPVQAARWYKQSAEAGYAPAQFNLGSAYIQGAGIAADKGRAAHWWEKAAAQDYSYALFNLATLYLRGDGVPLDVDKARDLYRRAAVLGDLRAQKVLEQIVLAAPPARPAAVESAATTGNQGGGVAGNSVSADVNSPPPPRSAPRVTRPEVVVESTVRETARKPITTTSAAEAAAGRGEEWLRRQDPGHYTIQVFAFTDQKAALTFARETGMGDELVVARASTKGKIWYKAFYGSYSELAQAKAAQDRLKQRLSRHVPWIRRFKDVSAELTDTGEQPLPVEAGPAGGQPQPRAKLDNTSPQSVATSTAERSVATAVDSNVAPSRDDDAPDRGGDSEAVNEAPERGGAELANADRETLQMEPRLIADASDQQQLQRGQSFFNRQEYVNALDAWRPLATKGIAQAQYGLGFMYESGWGVDRDYGQAFMWYERAARQGHAKSQYNLGMLFHNGLGVKRNEAKAFFWIQNAADGGDPRAGEYIQQATSN
jgi:TPR repeat protein